MAGGNSSIRNSPTQTREQPCESESSSVTIASMNSRRPPRRRYAHLPLTLVAMLAAIAAVGWLSLRSVERHLVARTGESLALAAAGMADKLDLFLFGRYSDIQALGNAEVFRGNETQAMSDHLAKVKDAFPAYERLWTTDTAGKVQASTNPTDIGRDDSARDWFIAVRNDKQTFFRSADRQSEAQPSAVAIFATPILSRDGDWLGVVTATAGLPQMDAIKNATRAFGLQGAAVAIEWHLLTQQGQILYDSTADHASVLDFRKLGLPSASKLEKTDLGFIEEDDRSSDYPVVTGFARTPDHPGFAGLHWTVLVHARRDDVLAGIKKLLWKLGLAGSCVVLPLFGQLIWSTRRLREDWLRTQRSEEWLITTLRSIGDAVISTDATGRVTVMNGVAQTLTGWAEPDALGKPLDDVLRLIHRTTRAPLESPFTSASRPRSLDPANGESILISLDGTERSIAESSAPMRDRDGTIIGVAVAFRDVTEHVLGEAALRASQEILQLITNNVSDLIAILDLEGRHIYDSASYGRLLGSTAPLYLRTAFDDIHPDDRLRVQGLFAETLLTGVGRRSEFRVVRADGGIVHIESVASLVRNDRGEPDKVLVVARDITERKAAELNIASTLQRLERQNKALAELANHPALLGNDLDAAFRVLTEFAATALQTSRTSIWFYNHDRSAMNCVALFKTGEGPVAQNTALLASDYPNYFRALADGRCIPAEDARTDPRTNEFTDGYLVPLGIHAMLDAPIRSGGKMVGAICNEDTAAPRAWTLDEQNFASSIADLVALCLEVWERREAEAAVRDARDNLEVKVAARTRELADANERLQELDRLKSQFLATMSHELRTPLNSIIGFTGILRQGLAGPLNPEQLKQLGMVNYSAKHLLGLINDLLDLSRIESGKMETVTERFPLNALVDEVIQTLKPIADQKDLILRSELPASEIELHSDRRKCFQILLNLTNNAVKFTEHGSVIITVQIGPDEVALTVSDTGIGVKPESMERLFEAFRQVDGSARRVYEGTGLGLYLCKQLTTMLGGRISAESEFGFGSRFTFTLPIKPETERTS